MNNLFAQLIEINASEKELQWLDNQNIKDNKDLQKTFVLVPRFISKKEVEIVFEQPVAQKSKYGTSKSNIESEHQLNRTWTLDRLVRVLLLTNVQNKSEADYYQTIETLFETAEINEAVALYTALPYLKYPQKWLYRATEAVRSNMGLVFDAIAFHNPYPAKYFSESAWNQLVLKCIFNDKPIHLIDGLDERANQNLANILSDFAHERWAAHRTIPPQVWRLVSKFITPTILEDITKLFDSENIQNQQAAALVCQESDNPRAKDLLVIKKKNLAFEINGLSWVNLQML
ncbi:MAG: EboA domain-containing protein [Arcicella sp.]|nr:EboA domain-containing protein [Arcicella sp.]